MLAGTVVVAQQRRALLPSVDRQNRHSDFTFTQGQLAAYGEFEVQVLQRILSEKSSSEKLAPIVKAITQKIRYTGRIPKEKEWDFLNAFYRAQRRYLEERLLIGKRKTNKLNEEADL